MDNIEIIIKQDGKEIRQIKTDCIMATVNDAEGDGVINIIVSNCKGSTILNTLRGLKAIEREVLKNNPLLVLSDLFERAMPDKRDFSKLVSTFLNDDN